MGFTTYTSKETVKARKVTAKEGETVVTQGGPQHAPKGCYVTEDGRVFSGEEFEARYRSNAKKKTSKRSTVTSVGPKTPSVKAGTKENTESTPSEARSAAERVKAARQARNAK